MHLLSIFVLAVISTGGATAVAEEPLISLQDAAPGLLTFNSGKQDGNAKDGAAMMANPDSDLVVDAACSPSSNQPRRQGKIRRGGICTPDGQSRASPLQGQHEEQPIAPYQMAPAEETPNDSSAASDDGSGGPICNPLIVGLNRQVAVCDNGRAINRILNINVRMPTIWPIGPTYSRGSYTIEDVSSWTPPGCRGTSIMWCCIETQPSRRDFLIAILPTPPWSIVGIDCVPAGGPALSQEFLGPIQPR